MSAICAVVVDIKTRFLKARIFFGTSFYLIKLQRGRSQDLMESPIITQLFKRLFRHRTCQFLPSHTALPFRINQQRRYLSDSDESPRHEGRWQLRNDLVTEDMMHDYHRFPMVTSDELRGRRDRPRRVKMLTRDFIEGK